MMNVALVAFQGEAMCFAHVLINALDMHEKGFNVKIIMEGAATKLIGELCHPDKPFANLYQQVKDKGLFDCVCKACAGKMSTLQNAQEQGFVIDGEILGHPSIGKYIADGYQVITF